MVILCVLCFQRQSFLTFILLYCSWCCAVKNLLKQVIFYFLWDHWVHPGYFENRIPLKPILGGRWGRGGGGGKRLQLRQLQCCIWRNSIKPSLPFSWFGVFSKFYRRHSALVEKYSVSLKTLLQQGISEPEFYGDLVYRFRKIVGKSNFSEQFRKLFNRYKRIGYSLDIMRQTACLVVNPMIVDGYASFFNYTTAVRASDSMTASS